MKWVNLSWRVFLQYDGKKKGLPPLSRILIELGTKLFVVTLKKLWKRVKAKIEFVVFTTLKSRKIFSKDSLKLDLDVVCNLLKWVEDTIFKFNWFCSTKDYSVL